MKLKRTRYEPQPDPSTTNIAQMPSASPVKVEPTTTSPETIDGKPAVRLPGDNRILSEFAADMGKILAAAGIYNRGGIAFKVDTGKAKLEPFDPSVIRTWAEGRVALYNLKQTKEDGWIKIQRTMSLDVARALVVAPQFIDQLPVIEGFNPVRMPVIRKAGKVELLPSGFDPESKILTDENGCEFDLDLPPEDGLEIIKDALREFPFPEDRGRSKAVAVAAMLTVYAGGILPTGSLVPCFVYLGNAEGSGKTTLAKLAGSPYGAIVAQSAPKSETEWQKRLLSLVMTGRRLVVLDNLKGHLNSPSLEAYLTATMYGDRILGVSKEFEGPADAVVLLTGNKLTITPDMRRRSLIVELFMSELRAEDRKFSRLLDDPGIVELQPDLLAAMWALVRGWDEAGRPASTRESSSFPRWGEVIGGIVEHHGFACPLIPAELEDGGDTDTADIEYLAGEVMQAGEPYPFADLADLCIKRGLFERFSEDLDPDGAMSRKSKAGLAKVFTSYHKRRVTPSRTFVVKGKGHGRRYLVEE